MKKNTYTQILHSVSKYNILPITSRCNVSCIFCSHHQNPPGLEVATMSPISMDTFLEILDFIDEEKKIIVGESATEIIEGEPFTHPQILEYLKIVRKRFPHTLIQITSNGSFFTEEIVEEIAKLKPIEFNLSLNSYSVQNRVILMNDKKAQISVQSPKVLNKYQLPYHGSIVAMPWISGWDDLEETIVYLASNGAQTIRVFEPGFTKYTQEKLKPPVNWQNDLHEKIHLLRSKISVPITLEPVKIKDLSANIIGVIPDSIASQAGIKAGDVIKSINDEIPFSRVEAFRKLEYPGIYKLELLRENKTVNIELRHKSIEKTGLVMDYDISREVFQNIAREIIRYKSNKPLIMVSKLGHEIINYGLSNNWEESNIPILLPTPSIYFGGTIQAAGLLVIEDFLIALREYLMKEDKPDLIIIPAIAFNQQGKDLTGRGYWEIEEEIGIKIIIL